MRNNILVNLLLLLVGLLIVSQLLILTGHAQEPTFEQQELLHRINFERRELEASLCNLNNTRMINGYNNIYQNQLRDIQIQQETILLNQQRLFNIR